MMIESLGWIWIENVPPLIEFAAGMEQLGPEELQAYVAMVPTTDFEQDRWCRVPLKRGVLHLAQDAGTAVVHVKADSFGPATEELRGVVAFLACYSATVRT